MKDSNVSSGFIIIIFCICSLPSCVKSPNFPDTPVIEFIGLSKSRLFQNSLNTDSLYLQFSFTDGDGDFGEESILGNQNIVLTDNRTGQIYDTYKAPSIPPQGASKGVSGEITILVFTTCCVFPDNIPPCEAPPDYPVNELTWDVYIVDRAGNQSNTITTEPIVLLCD